MSTQITLQLNRIRKLKFQLAGARYSVNRRMIILLITCSIGIVGCLDVKTNNKEREQKTSKLEQPKKIKEKNEQIEEQNEGVNIVDPNTSEVIQTIFPKDLGFQTNEEAYIEKIRELAKNLARGSENFPGYDQKMKLDKIADNGEIIKGNPMLILKESELVEKIVKASRTGEDVTLPLYLTESNYDLKEIYRLEEVMVASYTTRFNPSDVGRSKNIELSAKALNNVIVGKGDYFSFNTMVGPRNQENGYQEAPEIVNKKLVMGIGGGVCQTSSTLFNAVDQLPVKYIERHNHTLHVGYVPKGRDATVSYDILDFRFQNTSGVPFLIKTIYQKDKLKIEIRTSAKYENVYEN